MDLTKLIAKMANKQIEVECDDGENKLNFILKHPNMALLIPPGIWAQQRYILENSILTVLCDRIYEAEDYIREYSKYLKFINKSE